MVELAFCLVERNAGFLETIEDCVATLAVLFFICTVDQDVIHYPLCSGVIKVVSNWDSFSKGIWWEPLFASNLRRPGLLVFFPEDAQLTAKHVSPEEHCCWGQLNHSGFKCYRWLSVRLPFPHTNLLARQLYGWHQGFPYAWALAPLDRA